MKKTDVAIFGPYPPPIGGVSVHIERLSKYLKQQNKTFIIYDTSKLDKNLDSNYQHIDNMKLWLIKYFFKCNEKLIHLHMGNWYIVSIICLIAKLHKSKVILTLHSFRDEITGYSLLHKMAFKYSVKNLNCFITVGQNEKNKLVKYGCEENKVYVIPAYINPNYEKDDDTLIPDYVKSYIYSKEFIICANAYKLVFYNNQDLYGLDMCVELCYRLKLKYKDKRIGFIFCLPDIGDYEYYGKIKERIKKLKITNEFLLINGKIPFCPLLKKGQLFIRPTNTDGDSISIREALYYRVPVISSDVVERPEGATIFKNRDIDDLYEKTVDIIENYNYYKDKLVSIIVEDNAEKVLNVYETL